MELLFIHFRRKMKCKLTPMLDRGFFKASFLVELYDELKR